MAKILLVIISGVQSQCMVLSISLTVCSLDICICRIVYKLLSLFAYINLSSISFWYKTGLV